MFFKKLSLRAKAVLMVSLFLLATNLALGAVLIRQARSYTRTQIDERMLDVVITAAASRSAHSGLVHMIRKFMFTFKVYHRSTIKAKRQGMIRRRSRSTLDMQNNTGFSRPGLLQ